MNVSLWVLQSLRNTKYLNFQQVKIDTIMDLIMFLLIGGLLLVICTGGVVVSCRR